jgi:DNA invertase Pin-like site-specific DNA recombinase
LFGGADHKNFPKLGIIGKISSGQDLTLQLEALKAAGATKVYAEKINGARSDNRPQLARMLKALAPGDTVLVVRLCRLARSTRDLLNILDEITKAGAGFKSLNAIPRRHMDGCY